MRVTSDFFVSALMRRVFAEGGFAAVVRRGSTEAGAVFVLWRAQTGEVRLYGPAPQSGYDEARPLERQFVMLAEAGAGENLDTRIEKEARFDSDLWLVEIEDRREPGELLTILPAG